MDIQEDNDPWDNIVAEDAPTCLVRLDYLAEGEVVADAGDDGNIQNSLDRKGSSYNAAKDKVGTQAEDPHEASKEALGLLKIAKDFYYYVCPEYTFHETHAEPNVVGSDVEQLRAAARSDTFLQCRLAFAAAVSWSLRLSASLLAASELTATAGAALAAGRGWQKRLVRREE